MSHSLNTVHVLDRLNLLYAQVECVSHSLALFKDGNTASPETVLHFILKQIHTLCEEVEEDIREELEGVK